MISFERPTPERIAEVAANLTAIDRREVFDLTGLSPLDATTLSVADSMEAFIVEVERAPVAAFGVTTPSLLGGRAAPWFLFTDAARATATPASLWMSARPVVDGWLERCAMLENWVNPNHRRAVAWVKWLGFVVDDPAPAGPFGRPYHRFWRTA